MKPVKLKDEAEGRQLLVRAPKALFTSIDIWRRQQENLPGRAEAVRTLINIGLIASGVDVKNS